MNSDVEYILNDIAEMKAKNNPEMLQSLKDYWSGFEAGVDVILEVANRAKADLINPVKKTLESRD